MHIALGQKARLRKELQQRYSASKQRRFQKVGCSREERCSTQGLIAESFLELEKVLSPQVENTQLITLSKIHLNGAESQ